MELSYALLAKKADFGSDGLLSVIGADISVLGAESFPHTMDSLTVVVRMGFPPGEAEKQHIFEVIVYAPDGSKLNDDNPFPFSVQPAQPPNSLSYFGAIAVFDGIVLPTPGAYRFSVKLDSREERSIVLQMVTKNGALAS